jgi:hypothetical protein
MGLLDDAIREHLELKRRRGADPGEVAREQREALDSISRTERAAAGDDVAAAEEAASAGTYEVASLQATLAEDDLASSSQPASGGDLGSVGETAELDMRTVLGDDHRASAEDPPAGQVDAGSAESASGGEDPEEHSLEWEAPGEVADKGAAAAEGGEHLREDSGPDGTAAERWAAPGPGEDVLEETPDFLRDTPEQERLWFEQRPPRDFDFDK